MEHQRNQLLLRSDHSTSSSRSTENYSDLSNQLQYNQCNVNSNRLPNVESNVIYNRLPSDDSGVCCKCKNHSGSFSEATSNSSEDNQGTNSRNDETRRKSVSFSLSSSLNLIDENLCVTEINMDSDSETNSDPSFVINESTSIDKKNGNSGSQTNSYTSRHSRACTHGNAIRNNDTIFKRQRSAYSESDGNSIMLSHCNRVASKMNTRTTFPILGTSLNTEFRPDQRSILHHQQLPGPPCSTTTQSQHNFPQCLPGTCHDHTQPNLEATRFRSHPKIYHAVDRNFDPTSSALLLDDKSYIESHGHFDSSKESCVLRRETQPSKTVSRAAVSNITNNKTADEESAVSFPRSLCTNKTCVVVLMVFNIIFLVTIILIIFTLFNHRTYQECPLCKNVMDQMKGLKGGNLNESAIHDYIKENDRDGRCCLNHAFIFNLLAQTNPRNQAHQQYTESDDGNVIDIIRKSSEKAVLHLESLNGTIRFSSQPTDDGLPGQKSDMEMVKWNYDSKTTVKTGNTWDIIDSDTKIKIPLTGVYYIYAMVQYWYQPGRSTPPSDNIQNVGEFPLSISLYKIPPSPENKPSRIGTVTQHCKLATISIEHNIIIERIVRLTKDDKVFLAVSNKQFLKDGNKLHQIGLFRVD